MRYRICFFVLLIAAMAFQSGFAQNDGRRHGGPRRGSKRRGPEAIFHTDVPHRLLDVTLARPTDRSVTVVVTAHDHLTLSVAYGTTQGKYSATTPPTLSRSGDTAHLLLSSLKPNTRYYYRVWYQIQDTSSTESTPALQKVKVGRVSRPVFSRTKPCLQISQNVRSANSTTRTSMDGNRRAWRPVLRHSYATAGSTPEYTFHTQRPPGEPFCFTVQADSHLDEPNDVNVYLDTLKNAARAKPDFHIDLGDTFMTDKYGASYRDAEAQYYAQRYYFGQLCHSAPLFLTLGNHDGEAGWSFSPRANNISVWSHGMRTSLFPNPRPDTFYSGNTAQTPGIAHLEDYYAWQWGDAQFIVLDPFWPTAVKARSADGWRWTLGRTQYEWLRDTLETSDAAFKFVFIHNLVGGNDESARGGAEAAAFFEWGGHDLDGTYTFDTHRPALEMPIHDLLVKNDVSIVFHGHDHFLARQERDGVVYQLVPQPGHAGKQRTNAKRRGNRPNKASGNAHRMAADYGYHSGDILSGSGCLRIAVSPDESTVDFLLSDGNDLDTTVAYSYTITRKRY